LHGYRGAAHDEGMTIKLPIYEGVVADLGFSLESLRQGSPVPVVVPKKTKRERHKENRRIQRVLDEAVLP
jgi:hypothetical protein